jgi:hypothetical protein
MSSYTPTLISDWARSAGIDLGLVGAARHVTVTFDRVRLHLLELPGRGTLLESRIADLPMSPSERDRMVQSAMSGATGRMRDSPVVLCVNEESSALMLQLRVPLGADVQIFGAAVEKMVNEVDLWRAIL